MRRAPMLLLASALASGCGARQASDAESGPEPGEPDWSACIVEGEHETCAEVCEAQGMTCAVEVRGFPPSIEGGPVEAANRERDSLAGVRLSALD